MRTVQITKLAVDFDIRADLASHAASEIFPPLVLACSQKTLVDRKAGIKAVAPPGEKRAASRTRNGSRGRQHSGSMKEAAAGHNIAAPHFRDRNVDDGIEQERINMVCRAQRLRLLQSRGAQ